MGCFFVNQYDLREFIRKEKQSAVEKITKAVLIANSGRTMSPDDIKDACVAIASHEKYNEQAFNETNILFQALQEQLSVN